MWTEPPPLVVRSYGAMVLDNAKKGFGIGCGLIIGIFFALFAISLILGTCLIAV